MTRLSRRGADTDPEDGLDLPPRPAPRATPDFRRRRLLVVLGVAVVVAAGVVGLSVVLSDDPDRTDAPSGDVEVEAQDTGAVLQSLREEPCTLLTPQDVAGVVQLSFDDPDDAGGLCTYRTDDGTGTVAVQAFGPLATDAYGALVAEGQELEGTAPPARWLVESGGGRALALDGAVAVEVAVHIDAPDERQREVASALVDLATSRVVRNEARDAATTGGAPQPGGGCPLLTEAGNALLDGAELHPSTNPDVCSFATATGAITVELIEEPPVPLADIRRATTVGEDEQEWPREEVAVADGGVWLVPPGDGPTTGELYAQVGVAMVHVSVSDPDIEAARGLAIALAAEVDK